LNDWQRCRSECSKSQWPEHPNDELNFSLILSDLVSGSSFIIFRNNFNKSSLNNSNVQTNILRSGSSNPGILLYGKQNNHAINR
jgi:hypothetical protein